MVKYFCDLCGKEVKTNARLAGTYKTLGFEIVTSLNGTWNSGTFCPKCIIEAINSCYQDNKKKKK